MAGIRGLSVAAGRSGSRRLSAHVEQRIGSPDEGGGHVRRRIAGLRGGVQLHCGACGGRAEWTGVRVGNAAGGKAAGAAEGLPSEPGAIDGATAGRRGIAERLLGGELEEVRKARDFRLSCLLRTNRERLLQL